MTCPSCFTSSNRIFPRQVGNRASDRKYPIGRLARNAMDGETKDGAQIAATDRGLFTRIGDAAERLRPGCGARSAARLRLALRTRAGAPDHLARRTFHERSEEHTSELQSLMRISYAVFCLTKKKH